MDVYFQVQTPLNITVHTTKEYWQRIVEIKHPSIKRYEKQVKQALENPDQVRKSKQDANVYLYYKSIGKIAVCVVVDVISKSGGYIITAYLTDRIKEGEKVYDKN